MKKFPQANDLNLLLTILINIQDGVYITDVCKITEMVEREARYYLDALIFLDLIEKHELKYFLTEKGSLIKDSTEINRSRLFIKSVKSLEVIKICFSFISKHEDYLLTQYINENYNINNSTLKRRLQCIQSWYKIIKDFETGVIT